MACVLGAIAAGGAISCSAMGAGDELADGEYGTGGGWGNGAGGYGEPGDPPPPPKAPPKEEPVPAEPTCQGVDQSKPVVLYLSADDSNSMSSPVQAREHLRAGRAPHAIRTYEFLNYYRIGYKAPAAPDLALFAEAEAGANAGEIDLQLGIRSFDAVKPRRAMTLTFVLDTSGSMEGTPMERQIAAVKAFAGSLAFGDVISMVTWNTENLVVLDSYTATGPNDPAVLAAAGELTAGGGTDLAGGLERGYELAKQSYGENRINRVILISDGGANVGETDANVIGNSSEDADKEGIYLVGVGVGDGYDGYGYSDELMDIVTDRGRGAYVYLDSEEEAKHMFIDRFDETMEVAARGVQVELTLPWYFQIQKFFGEEYSENPEEIEPQHLAPSDAMVLSQVLKACDPKVIDEADAVKMRVTWKTPLSYESREATFETTVGDLLAADKPHLAKGKAIVAYAEALKAGTSDALAAALAKVKAANPSGNDKELNEIADLIVLHPNL